ncbi:MAG: SagB/ThcOx family dehydrogenase [Candidatus Izemoplasmatales bacterium]
MDDRIKRNRETIKPNWLDLYSTNSPKRQGFSKPNQFLEPTEDMAVIDLLVDFPSVKQKTLTEVIKSRRSLREYEDSYLSFEELSYLLWETSRVDSYNKNAVFRTIPTAGATNSMETYLFINKVEKIKCGMYLYVQDTHQIALVKRDKDLSEMVDKALMKQLRNAHVVFMFTCIPERTEYKYDFCAHKMIAIEAGHACQNLSLAAEVIDAGICAISAYNQELIDQAIGIDGVDHFTIYCATVGKKKLNATGKGK